MGIIIRNGRQYLGGGDGAVDITEAGYKELVATGQVNPNTTYFITDGNYNGGGNNGGSGSSNNGSGGVAVIKVTQAEYDALSEEEQKSGIYFIKDSEDLTAKNMAYDGSETGLGNNVQDAIDELDNKVEDQNKKIPKIKAGIIPASSESIEGGKEQKITMNFDEPFETEPIVVCTPNNDAFTIQIGTISTDGFSIYVYNVKDGTRTFNGAHWIAISM